MQQGILAGMDVLSILPGGCGVGYEQEGECPRKKTKRCQQEIEESERRKSTDADDRDVEL